MTVGKSLRINQAVLIILQKKHELLDKVCVHMKPQGHLYKRFVYTIGCHQRKIIYIGLSFNLNQRIVQHRKKNQRIIKYFGNDFNYLWRTDKPIDAMEAQGIECELIERYKKEGYKVLNVNKGGGLGWIKIEWTFEKCKEEALKYGMKVDFQKKSRGAYNASWKNGWLDEVCGHMKGIKKRGYWTFEKCKEEALKYDSRRQFQLNSSSAHSSARKNKWFDEICSHMKTYKQVRQKPTLKSTISECDINAPLPEEDELWMNGERVGNELI